MKAKPERKAKKGAKPQKKPPGPKPVPVAQGKGKSTPQAHTKAKPMGKPIPRPIGSAEGKFTRDLLLRGEAVPPPAPGEKLPPGSTHVLTGDEEGTRRTVKRIRVSLR